MKIKILEKVRTSITFICAPVDTNIPVAWSTTSWRRRDGTIQVNIYTVAFNLVLTWIQGSLTLTRSHLHCYKCQKWHLAIPLISSSWKMFISTLAWIRGSQWLGRMVLGNQPRMSGAIVLLCCWLVLVDRIKLLTGELNPLSGHVTRNGRLRMWVSISFYVDKKPTHRNLKRVLCSTSRRLLKS